MRKLKMHVHVSLDGYASDAKGGFAWITYNSEIEAHAHGLTRSADTVVFGRNTYKGMQSYWRTVPGNPNSTPAERSHADWLARSTKIAVSTTMTKEEANWDRTILLGADFADEIRKLKAEPGGDMVSFGSPGLVRSCVRLGLFDELHLNIGPVVLGGGQLLFGPQDKLGLNLVHAKPMEGGVVALCYTPAAA